VQLWEGVALASNKEPTEISYLEHEALHWRKGPLLDRLETLARVVENRESSPSICTYISRNRYCVSVKLSSFAQWAADVAKWDVPKERDLARPDEPRKGDTWPWGNHTTDLLDAMAAAGNQFWRQYNSADVSTAPRSDDVVKWLKARGVADSNARKIAAILRPKSIPTGPRPPKRMQKS
jgi:hypothetical protein